jgi:outer membrane beta-barrel protein
LKLHIPLLFLAASAAHAQSSTSDLEAAVLSGDVDAASAPESADIDTEIPPVADAQDAPSRSDLEKVDEAVRGPRQIPNEHVLVVQRRFVQKEGAHEITPISIGVQPADSFRRQVQWGFSYIYHLNEDFGFELAHIAYTTNYNTGLNDNIADFTSGQIGVPVQTARIEPVLSGGVGIQWSPLKSKAAAFDSIYYFEGYFLGGGGFTKLTDASAGMAMFGIGFRSYLSKNAIFKSELRNYMDFRSQINHRPTIIIGASILLGGGS